MARLASFLDKRHSTGRFGFNSGPDDDEEEKEEEVRGYRPVVASAAGVERGVGVGAGASAEAMQGRRRRRQPNPWNSIGA